MDDRKSKLLVLAVSLLFVLVNAILISRETMSFNLLPFFLVALLFVLFEPNKLYFILIFLAPLSIPFSEFVSGLDFDFWFPTEPLIFTLLILVIFRSLQDRYFEKNLVNHPVFWVILFYLGWLIISTISSEMPLVSAKYFLVRLWFIAVFFYLSYLFFKQNPKSFSTYFFFYLVGLAIVVFISLNKQVARGLFDKFSAHGACNPYFTDHTSYGAALAFVIPVILGYVFVAKGKWKKIILSVTALFFISALILSYSRAAWLSLIVAGGIWLLWFLKIRFRTILISSFIIGTILFSFHEEIGRMLSMNQNASSGNLQEHLNSITNIKTDESNVERLNRWTSAIRMFEERPLLGWGPGTYMFKYAPFQSSYLKTTESSDLGKKGNAHSEYLGLMSEAGWPAALGYVLLIVVVLYRAFRLIKKISSNNTRVLLLSVSLGLITYVVHGVLNNFLDMDKIAVLFWGYIAFIVAADINYSNKLLEVESKDGNIVENL